MNSKFVLLVLCVALAILLSLLPIYPLLVEGREISSAGESLYQEWRFVSIPEFFNYAQFARTAWQDSTKVTYALLAVIHSLVLLSLSWFASRGLSAILRRIKG